MDISWTLQIKKRDIFLPSENNGYAKTPPGTQDGVPLQRAGQWLREAKQKSAILSAR
jgi:hypothetical protein